MVKSSLQLAKKLHLEYAYVNLFIPACGFEISVSGHNACRPIDDIEKSLDCRQNFIKLLTIITDWVRI